MTKNQERQMSKEKRLTINARIDEIIQWLGDNSASATEWDSKVRDLHALNMQLAATNRPARKYNAVDYHITTTIRMPEMQY